MIQVHHYRAFESRLATLIPKIHLQRDTPTREIRYLAAHTNSGMMQLKICCKNIPHPMLCDLALCVFVGLKAPYCWKLRHTQYSI
jgi:hypothetical protein